MTKASRMHAVNIRLKQTGFDNIQGDNVAAFAGRLCSRRNRFGPCYHHKVLITSLTTTIPVVYQIFQHYMFNMESRDLLNLSVQNALDCILENFNLKNFPGGACARNSLEKCAVHSPDGRYRAHIATVYYIFRPPLSQNPPSATDYSFKIIIPSLKTS